MYYMYMYLLPLSVSKDPIMQLGWKTGAIIPELQVICTCTCMYIYMCMCVYNTSYTCTCIYVNTHVHYWDLWLNAYMYMYMLSWYMYMDYTTLTCIHRSRVIFIQGLCIVSRRYMQCMLYLLLLLDRNGEGWLSRGQALSCRDAGTGEHAQSLPG